MNVISKSIKSEITEENITKSPTSKTIIIMKMAIIIRIIKILIKNYSNINNKNNNNYEHKNQKGMKDDIFLT